eukprot:1156504-Pelagomonas_calceolata.AAC.17
MNCGNSACWAVAISKAIVRKEAIPWVALEYWERARVVGVAPSRKVFYHIFQRDFYTSLEELATGICGGDGQGNARLRTVIQPQTATRVQEVWRARHAKWIGSLSGGSLDGQAQRARREWQRRRLRVPVERHQRQAAVHAAQPSAWQCGKLHPGVKEDAHCVYMCVCVCVGGGGLEVLPGARPCGKLHPGVKEDAHCVCTCVCVNLCDFSVVQPGARPCGRLHPGLKEDAHCWFNPVPGHVASCIQRSTSAVAREPIPGYLHLTLLLAAHAAALYEALPLSSSRFTCSSR